MPMKRPCYDVKYSIDTEGKVTFLNDLQEFEDLSCLYTYTLFCVPFDTFVTRLDQYNLEFIELYCIRNKLSQDQIARIFRLLQDQSLSKLKPTWYPHLGFFYDAADKYRPEDIYFYDQMISNVTDHKMVHIYRARKLCYMIVNASRDDALKHCKDAVKTLDFEEMNMMLEFCRQTNNVYCMKYIVEELARTHDKINQVWLGGPKRFAFLLSIGYLVKSHDEDTSAIRILDGAVSINRKDVPREVSRYFI